MRIDVVTLFPELVGQIESYGVVGRGIRQALLRCEAWNPRDYCDDPRGRIDDRPYGGGPGMVMQAEPLASTLAAVRQAHGAGDAPVIMLSPQGERFDQGWASHLASGDGFTLVCGRYEGVDQRFIDAHVDVQLSAGDFVLSGGELPAMMIIDAVARLVPGVLGDDRSAEQESFVAGPLDHPHYTRPETLDGGAADAARAGPEVPAILLSGDHERIARWREKQALGMTWRHRPDLLSELSLTKHQRALLAEFIAEHAKP